MIWLPHSPDGAAQEMIDTTSYSFTNSPMLIAPKADLLDGELRLSAAARFVNDCFADTGMVADYADLGGNGLEHATDRIIVLRQKINPQGCPEIFQPVVRSVEIVSPAAGSLRRLFILDEVVLRTGAKPTAPPVVLPIDRDAPVRREPRKAHRVVAGPIGGVGGLPTLTAARVATVTRNALLRYTVETAARVTPGIRPSRAFHAWRYETRIGGGEPGAPPVTDWLIVVARQAAPSAADQDGVEGRFSIELEGVAGVGRRLAIVNPLVRPLAHRDPAATTPFTFIAIR